MGLDEMSSVFLSNTSCSQVYFPYCQCSHTHFLMLSVSIIYIYIFPIFLLSNCLCLYLKFISCRQHIVGSQFYIQSSYVYLFNECLVHLYLIAEFKSTVLLFVVFYFYLLHKFCCYLNRKRGCTVKEVVYFLMCKCRIPGASFISH